MGKHEYRLRVVSASGAGTQIVFLARGMADRLRKNLYLCGSCSIIFAPTSDRAIRSGMRGSCQNCGALNQL